VDIWNPVGLIVISVNALNVLPNPEFICWPDTCITLEPTIAAVPIADVIDWPVTLNVSKFVTVGLPTAELIWGACTWTKVASASTSTIPTLDVIVWVVGLTTISALATTEPIADVICCPVTAVVNLPPQTKLPQVLLPHPAFISAVTFTVPIEEAICWPVKGTWTGKPFSPQASFPHWALPQPVALNADRVPIPEFIAWPVTEADTTSDAQELAPHLLLPQVEAIY